jgi:hypothetical protein
MLAVVGTSCSSSRGGGRRASADAGAAGNTNNPNLNAGLAAPTLNAGILLPPTEGDPLMNPATDETVTVMPPVAAPEGPSALRPGDTVTVEIPFEAPNGNVVGAGIRFGETGPIRTVGIDAATGQTANTLTFDFQVPQDICDDLADICHSITCYEFAVTDIGEISVANLTPIALACAGCDEPTCQPLLMCDAPPAMDAGMVEVGMPCTPADACVPGSECFEGYCVGTGTLRVSLAFDVVSDFDLHVLTPLGNEIYYGNRSIDGGTLDVDQCVGNGCEAGITHVENIVFDATAPTGTYEVWVVNFNGGGAGAFTIEVAGDVNQTFTGSLTATSREESMRFMFTL